MGQKVCFTPVFVSEQGLRMEVSELSTPLDQPVPLNVVVSIISMLQSVTHTGCQAFRQIRVPRSYRISIPLVAFCDEFYGCRSAFF